MNLELHDLIKNAQGKLLLISPYLSINRQIQELLADKKIDAPGVRLIYGKEEKRRSEQIAFLKSLPHVSIGFREFLHAKCYLNEDVALMGSMNLYEFSQVNNDEMGILVRRATDPQLYADICTDAERIARVAKPVTHRELGGEADTALPAGTGRLLAPVRGATAVRATPPERAPRKTVARDEGFCIRCSEPIALDPDRPYCTPHYKVWAQWSDPDYEDPHCHGCGRTTGASMAKPLCRSCYKRLES
jgi:phosphatidylserine/phosphatidylglycerophosphate/cardiolipin synthase-like enzyme